MSVKARRILFFGIIILVIVCIIAFIVIFVLLNNQKSNSQAAENTENYYSTPDTDNVVTDEKSGEKYVNNELLLSANENSNYSDIEKLAKTYNAEIVGYIKAFDEYQIRFKEAYSKSNLLEIIDNFEKDELVEYASLNYGMNLSPNGYYTPNDPWGDGQNWDSNVPEGNNWGVEAINAPQAWDHRDEMTEITIGLMDDGFEDHDDLTFEWTRDYGTKDHGCHVAGIMAADFDNNKGLSGVMPTKKSNGEKLVKLMGITYNANDLCYIVEYKSALAELILRGTKVINISQGVHWNETDPSEGFWKDNNITDKARNETITLSKPMEAFLSRCINRNYDFVLVCAAGNNGGIDARYCNPISAIEDEEVKQHIIVVGGIKNLGRGFNLFGDGAHSGYGFYDNTDLGDRVDIMAPGVGIYSCLSNNGYDCMNGTSMAAPHVSGVAAMVWSLNPKLTGKEVKTIVVETADRPIEKNGIKYNILNAEKAVNIALGIEKTLSKNDTPSTEYGSAIGKVVDANTDELISNATVKAYTTNGDYIDTAVTDDYGQFEILLEEGTYKITASSSGYNESSIDNVTIQKKQVNYLDWLYLKEKEKTTIIQTEPPTQPKADVDFLIGDWSTSDDVYLSFYDDGVFVMDWGYFPEEEGNWSAEAISNDTIKIDMDGSSILSMMSMLYGNSLSDYHFEVLKCNDDNFYLVQVYGDYTARTSPCKLGFTRDGAKRNFNLQ